jgi:hypothetical protein
MTPGSARRLAIRRALQRGVRDALPARPPSPVHHIAEPSAPRGRATSQRPSRSRSNQGDQFRIHSRVPEGMGRSASGGSPLARGSGVADDDPGETKPVSKEPGTGGGGPSEIRRADLHPQPR